MRSFAATSALAGSGSTGTSDRAVGGEMLPLRTLVVPLSTLGLSAAYGPITPFQAMSPPFPKEETA